MDLLSFLSEYGNFMAGIGAIGAALVICYQLGIHNQQLKIQKFETFFDNVGSRDIKKHRKKILHEQEYYEDIHLLAGKNYNSLGSKLRELSSSVVNLAARYDRIAFLASKDKELEKWLIIEHGVTFGRIWKRLHPKFIDWTYEGVYCHFMKYGETAYCKHKEKIDSFLNKDTSKSPT